MADNDDDLQKWMGDAVNATEKEIFNEAVGGPGETLDETGDTSLEATGEGLEGQDEPDEDGAEGNEDKPDGEEAPVDKEAKDDQPRGEDGKFIAKDAKDVKAAEATPAADAKPDPKANARVPLNELEKERDKRQAAEQKAVDLEKAFNERFAALEAKIGAPAKNDAQPVEQPKPAEAPDMFLDPQGYQRWVQSEIQATRQTARQEMQLQVAAIKHGDVFNKAYAEFSKLNPRDPQALQIGRTIANSPDVGEAMVKWFRESDAIRRIGSDPDAYEAKVKAEARDALVNDPEFRKSLLESMQADAASGDNGKPRTAIKLPPSLNGAAGSNSARIADPDLMNNSDESVFRYAMRDSA